MGAVKAFFNAFADRTMAYNLKNVISLVYFDDQYVLKCTFTEVFAQFKELVNRAKPRGMTALYAALIKASEALLDFKKKYPTTLLRIIALTDGEENKNTSTPELAALKIISSDIILDSFIVGPESKVIYKKILTLLDAQTNYSCDWRKSFCSKNSLRGFKTF